MIQFILNNIFYADCHQMIVMETTCLWKIEIYYCDGYVPYLRQIFFQSSQMWVKDWPRKISLYHNIVSMQVFIRCLLWRLYDSRCILLWWMCSIVSDYMLLIKCLFATWCGSVPLDCSYVLLWIDTVVFYFCSDCIEDYQQFIGDNHQSDEWWTQIF